MPIITSNLDEPQETTEPPLPIITALTRWVSGLLAVVAIAQWFYRPAHTADAFEFRLQSSLLAAGAILILLGIGQAIQYLAASAHYSRLTFEALERSKRSEFDQNSRNFGQLPRSS